MARKTVLSIMMSLLLLGTLALVFNVQLVRASGTIYIRADGSIDPPAAPIFSTDNITYTLTGNITADNNGIVIERDNIVVEGAGYTVQGPNLTVYDEGMRLYGRSNVTIENINVNAFYFGVYVLYSSNISVIGNNMTSNHDAIYIQCSSDSSVTGNNMTQNGCGVGQYCSNDTSINGNNITENNIGVDFEGDEIGVDAGGPAIISGNIISENGYGIYSYACGYITIIENNIINTKIEALDLYMASDSSIYHNNFINNTSQGGMTGSLVWDDGYPSGGNYWSDYNGTDIYKGPYQNETGSDMIGDNPYATNSSVLDHYPLMNPWSPYDIAITDVTPSKTVVGLGYSVEINVTVMNLGDFAENFNLTTDAINALSSVHSIEGIETESVLGLLPNETRFVTLEWNTTGWAYGNYTVEASASTVQGETNTANNNCTEGIITLTIPGDIDGDFNVNLGDLVLLSNAYGTSPSQPVKGSCVWNPNADIDGSGSIDLGDLVTLANHYRQRASWADSGTLQIYAAQASSYIPSFVMVSGNKTYCGTTTSDPNSPLTLQVQPGAYTVSGNVSGNAQTATVTVNRGEMKTVTLTFSRVSPSGLDFKSTPQISAYYWVQEQGVSGYVNPTHDQMVTAVQNMKNMHFTTIIACDDDLRSGAYDDSLASLRATDLVQICQAQGMYVLLNIYPWNEASGAGTAGYVSQYKDGSLGGRLQKLGAFFAGYSNVIGLAFDDCMDAESSEINLTSFDNVVTANFNIGREFFRYYVVSTAYELTTVPKISGVATAPYCYFGNLGSLGQAEGQYGPSSRSYTVAPILGAFESGFASTWQSQVLEAEGNGCTGLSYYGYACLQRYGYQDGIIAHSEEWNAIAAINSQFLTYLQGL